MRSTPIEKWIVLRPHDAGQVFDPDYLLIEDHRFAAVEAVGAGVAVERNVFEADDSAVITAAVASVIHRAASVDKVMVALEKQEKWKRSTRHYS